MHIMYASYALGFMLESWKWVQLGAMCLHEADKGLGSELQDREREGLVTLQVQLEDCSGCSG